MKFILTVLFLGMVAMQHIQFVASSNVGSQMQSSASHLVAPTRWLNLKKVLGMRGGESKVVHVSDVETFEQQLVDAGEKLVVVDFSASWCMPCKMIAPLYDEFSEAEEFAEKVVFLKVDVDELAAIAEKYQVMSMPTFLFVKNGVEVDRFSGANVEKLQQVLTSLIE